MMKKRYQVILLAAGICAAAQPFAAFADGNEMAGGWQMEGEQWIYLEEDGTRASDRWVRDGEDWYYLNGDGYMASDQFIDGDSLRYVDSDGKMVKDRWISVENRDENGEELCEQDVSVLWYYFDRDGKAKDEEGEEVLIPVKKEGEDEAQPGPGGQKDKYFFDSDGHMLSGWQKVTNQKGETKIYYLGTENEGYAHLRWQYLEPDEEMFEDESLAVDYDAYEMFYFGWNGDMTMNDESRLEGKHFLFDANGVMQTGWQPGFAIDEEDYDINKYYDETNGSRASGWLYAYDPGDSDKAHWFYCDDKTGYVFNEGGVESEDGRGIGVKTIRGKSYFFDRQGRMITGLICTDPALDPGTDAFTEDEFADLEGCTIGKKGSLRYPGIYYLSQKDSDLGELRTNELLKLSDGYEENYYYLDSKGRAYINAVVKDNIFGPDGRRLQSDSGWEVIEVEEDIYERNDYKRDGTLDDNAEPLIRAGESVIVNSSGKLKKHTKARVDGVTYEVGNNYVATPVEKD